MADLDQAYAQLATGTMPTGLQPHEVGMLLSRAERAQRSEAIDDRMGGLRAAATIGGREALVIVASYLKDPALVVRRYVVELAVAAQKEGLPVLRDAVTDVDERLAVEALNLLTVAVDKASTARARQLLASPSAKVRAAALMLLGHVAGPVVKREVAALQSDPDPEVKRVAAEALDRMDGRLPRRAASDWWLPGATASLEGPRNPAITDVSRRESVPALTEGAPIPAAPAAVPPPPTPALPPARLPAAPPPPTGATSGKTPTPIEAAELLRRFARADEAQRTAMLADLRRAGEFVLAAAQRLRVPGTDPDLGRGSALAARYLDIPAWGAHIRRLLTDPDAGVRAEAAEAMGTVGRGPAIVTSIAALCSDRDPRVRAAAVRGLGVLARTLGRTDIVAPRLAALADDADPDVKRAVADLTAGLPR